MSLKLSNWLRSKTGMTTVGIVVVLALVVAVAGQQFGWWGGPGAAGTAPDPGTCGVVETQYTVESPASIPFYGIKYTFSGGQNVKSGAADNFSFVVPTDVAQSLSLVTLHAMAKPYAGRVNIDGCNFSGPEACNTPILDPTKRFSFQFTGAQDNGDGTMTMNFYVQVVVAKPLTWVAMSLPSGVTTTMPVGSYTGATCPTN